jgi:hypothetical protein
MVLSKFLFLFLSEMACAATASQSQGGIIVERGLPDGIYQASVVQGPSFEPPSAVSSGHRSLRRWKTPPGQGDFHEKPGKLWMDDYSVPIPASRHSCHKDRRLVLNSTEYRRAAENLWDYCQKFNVPYHGTHFSIVGDVMVYVCAYGGERRCHRHEWNEAEHIMDKKCGERKGSHVQMEKFLMEYGRAYVGKRVCSSFNFGGDIVWKAERLDVLVNGQTLDDWKAGASRHKAGDDGKKNKAIDDGKKKDKTG